MAEVPEATEARELTDQGEREEDMSPRITVRLSDGIRYLLLSSLSFLFAFSLRDTVSGIKDHFMKVNQGKFWKYTLYQFLFCIVVLAVTISIAIGWKDNRTYIG
jgi:hypothetical protein